MRNCLSELDILRALVAMTEANNPALSNLPLRLALDTIASLGPATFHGDSARDISNAPTFLAE